MWKPLVLETLLDHIYQCFPGYKFTMYYFDAEVWWRYNNILQYIQWCELEAHEPAQG